jgi:hypothetical protein
MKIDLALIEDLELRERLRGKVVTVWDHELTGTYVMASLPEPQRHVYDRWRTELRVVAQTLGTGRWTLLTFEPAFPPHTRWRIAGTLWYVLRQAEMCGAKAEDLQAMREDLLDCLDDLPRETAQTD